MAQAFESHLFRILCIDANDFAETFIEIRRGEDFRLTAEYGHRLPLNLSVAVGISRQGTLEYRYGVFVGLEEIPKCPGTDRD